MSGPGSGEEAHATDPPEPSSTAPGRWVKVSQIDGALPSACGAPSIWYDAVATPNASREPSGSACLMGSCKRLHRLLSTAAGQQTGHDGGRAGRMGRMEPPTGGVVSFTAMQDGTAEDYRLLDRIDAEQLQSFPDRVLGWLLTMEDSAGYQVTRLEHSLQA